MLLIKGNVESVHLRVEFELFSSQMKFGQSF